MFAGSLLRRREGRERVQSGADEAGCAADICGHCLVDLGGCAGAIQVFRQGPVLDAPQAEQGTAAVFGYDIGAQADAVRSVISLTGQFAALEENLSARENLLLMARLRGYGKQAAGRVADELIDRFGIGEFSGQLVRDVPAA
ncbi:MAG: hypothetical protein ACLQB1_40470 [Streptosporangiaceae bacterium]